MALLKPQRLTVLALTAALTLLLTALLAATLAAPKASAFGGVNVSDLEVKSVTVDPQTKVATAKGTVKVTGHKRGYVVVGVTQTVGRVHTAYAEGFKGLKDRDGTQRFSIELTNHQGRLGPGDANIEAYSEAWSRRGWDTAYFAKTLQVSNAH